MCKVRLSFVCKVKEQYPITLLQMKNGQSVLSTNFRENIRQYNSALSFISMGEVNAKSKTVNGKGLTLKVAFTQFLPSLPSLPTQISSLPINRL